MSEPAPPQRRRRRRGRRFRPPSWQSIRLYSGLILFAYVVTHYLNHALGLVSLQALEAGREAFLLVWRNPLGTLVLYGALVVHVVLVLIALVRRRRLRMPAGEAFQYILGFAIPIVLALHVIANRGAHEIYGLNDTYAYVLMALWVFKPWAGVVQVLAVLVVWIHCCLGIYYWLRLKPWFDAARFWLFLLAILLPALALAGFSTAGHEVMLLVENEAWRSARFAEIGEVNDTMVREIDAATLRMQIGSLVVVALALLIRQGRLLWERRRARFTVTYPDGRSVTVETGNSVLEASRLGGIPHASVCGGRGRCSTCRVRIVASAADVPAAEENEQRVLQRVGAGDGVRLACQCRPAGNLSVIPLLPAAADAKEGFQKPGYLQGSEREIAVLFADIRSFTTFSEQKLPYDVVFVVNQYFRYMGTAIESAGGRLDKFIGDGVMALFGIETGIGRGSREALAGARAMAVAMAQMNEHLKDDLPKPLRIGIGIHAGPAIVGEMGYREASSVTAIGDTVNTASRLEGLTKEFTCQLVISKLVADAAGLDLSAQPTHTIAVRGRDEPMEVYAIADARDLPEDLATPPRRRRRRAEEAEDTADA